MWYIDTIAKELNKPVSEVVHEALEKVFILVMIQTYK